MPPRKAQSAPTPEQRDALELGAIERRRIISLDEGARLLGISRDTLTRMSLAGRGPRIIRLSPRRVGVRLGDVLALADAAE